MDTLEVWIMIAFFVLVFLFADIMQDHIDREKERNERRIR